MAAVLVPVILIVIVLAVAVVAIRAFSRKEEAPGDVPQSDGRHSVRYQVPLGQDPAVVLHHLESEGYDVSHVPEPGQSAPIIVIGTPDAGVIDREGVRRTISELDETHLDPAERRSAEPHPVTFLDE